MIKILKKSELHGADKYGECIACGVDAQSSGKDIYKIEFESTCGKCNSVNICRDCAVVLADMIDISIDD